MTKISVNEARERFGPLLEPRAKSWREFEDADGLWRPEHSDEGVKNYRLYPTRPKVKIKKWKWPKR